MGPAVGRLLTKGDHIVVRHEAVVSHLAGRGVLVDAVVEANELLNPVTS